MHGEETRARTIQFGVGAVFADHRIEGLLGQGGMGVVYRATDLRLNRSVALKIIKPELSLDDDFRHRFRRESELAASIRHPNVVTIYQAGDSDGLLYVTMDLIEGTDLRAMLGERGRLDPGTAASIGSQIAAALDAAHAHGLVHRDVKPANILVANGAPLHVYLTDFGLTKRTSSQSGLTKTGLFVGTLDYAAPEQIKGWPVDARTDVYALGCVWFEMVAGQPPFRRDNDMATLYAHMTEPAPSLATVVPGVPQALDDAVQRALAKEPDDRYPSAGDLARATAAAAAGQAPPEPERTVATGRAAPGPPVATVFEPPQPPSHVTSVLPPQRSPWPVAIAVIVALLVAGGIAIALLSGGDDGGGTQAASAGDAQQQADRQQQRQQGQVQPADELRAPVEQMGALLDLSAEGRAVTIAGDFQAAADNRREILGQLDAMTVPAELESPRLLFQRAMQASLAADLAHQDCGTCPSASSADRRASFFKRRFVRAFNPYAQRYLQRSFNPNEI
jgi:serine/threonine-protein kinase